MVTPYASKGRYKPKHTSLGGQVFDSAFEASVWKELIRIRHVDTTRQHSLLLKPKTDKFKEITWAVDFLLKANYSTRCGWLYVEAKGALTAEFLLSIKLLEYRAPADFASLLIVIPDSFPNNEKGLKVIRRLDAHHLRWCCKCDLKDTVRSRLLLPNA